MPAKAHIIADAAMIRMYERGVTTYTLAELYGCNATTISAALKRAGMQVKWAWDKAGRKPNKPKGYVDPRRCPRCEILLSEAPEGDGEVCGYCVQDREERKSGIYERLPGLHVAA